MYSDQRVHGLVYKQIFAITMARFDAKCDKMAAVCAQKGGKLLENLGTMEPLHCQETV